MYTCALEMGCWLTTDVLQCALLKCRVIAVVQATKNATVIDVSH